MSEFKVDCRGKEIVKRRLSDAVEEQKLAKGSSAPDKSGRAPREE